MIISGLYLNPDLTDLPSSQLSTDVFLAPTVSTPNPTTLDTITPIICRSSWVEMQRIDT